ncbi:MAG TPA: mechanosensitive ion channel family protein [Candidatus Pseudogracilibacillus intestinigallinarum]|uniref:Mechanosensitive ion channel family protein n=2 Tax=Pseudogracilibacillus TaxID=1494958 RepID=A0A9D1PN77_9BACI|nr:mechanosensitive ion channel family protein [Candidatus Pseudogracilibacillus intestinigallinarum]
MESVWQNLYSYIVGEELWIWIGTTLLRIVTIILFAFIVRNIGYRVIDIIFKDKKTIPIRLTSNRREQTLKNLSKNILSYVLLFIVVLMILDIFDVPIRTMLAGAGIAGVAIGFGAQSLVKDVIAGFFIIFEDQFSVGDYIEIGAIEGDVEVIGLRSTKLRSFYGQTYVIPNGQINIVTNYSASNGYAMVEINIPYETNIVKVENMIKHILPTFKTNYPDVFVDEPFIQGVTALELSNYVLRVRAETFPVMQWEGARLIRKDVKAYLFEHGIEIPSPRMVVYSKDNETNAREVQ